MSVEKGVLITNTHTFEMYINIFVPRASQTDCLIEHIDQMLMKHEGTHSNQW